jgi:hypothetical protein
MLKTPKDHLFRIYHLCLLYFWLFQIVGLYFIYDSISDILLYIKNVEILLKYNNIAIIENKIEFNVVTHFFKSIWSDKIVALTESLGLFFVSFTQIVSQYCLPALCSINDSAKEMKHKIKWFLTILLN